MGYVFYVEEDSLIPPVTGWRRQYGKKDLPIRCEQIGIENNPQSEPAEVQKAPADKKTLPKKIRLSSEDNSPEKNKLKRSKPEDNESDSPNKKKKVKLDEDETATESKSTDTTTTNP